MQLRQLAVVASRHSKLLMTGWALFLIVFGCYAFQLPSVLQDHGLMPKGTYKQAEQLMSSQFSLPRDPVMLVFEKQAGVTRKQFHTFIEQTIAGLFSLEGLNTVISPLTEQGMQTGHAAYALLDFSLPPRKLEPVLAELAARLPESADVAVKMTGKPVVQADVDRASRYDLAKAELIGIPLAFLILWLAFGGIVSALIPVATGLIGVASTMGIMYWLGTRLEFSSFLLNVIPMAGLALSIDFALMLVSRFREELQQAPPEHALVRTMTTAGRAVLYSAATVFFGLFGILFIPLPMFTSIAIGAMVVLIVSVLVALTLVPAILSVCWRAVGKEQRRSLGSLGSPQHSRSLRSSRLFRYSRSDSKGRLPLFSRYAMHNPVSAGLLAVLFLLVCFFPLMKIHLVIPDATSLPSSYSSRQAFEQYEAMSGSKASAEAYIIVQRPSGGSGQSGEPGHSGEFGQPGKAGRTQLQTLLAQLRREPYVKQVSLAAASERLLLLQIKLTGEPSSQNVRTWLAEWEQKGKGRQGEHEEQETLRGQAAVPPFLIGGEAKYQQEVYDAVFHNIGKVLLFVLVSNFIVLYLAFRSVLIPLKTIAMNLLSLGAAFGILVWIYEYGLWGLEAGGIAIMIPVFIFGLVFGISMDYGVFLLSRIHEAYRGTGDNRQAVRTGLAAVSRIIGSAAAIMIAVTLPFSFGEVIGVKQLGLGIAAAIFIDATVIRMVLVPSLMILFGRWNWWAPGRK